MPHYCDRCDARMSTGGPFCGDCQVYVDIHYGPDEEVPDEE